MTKEERDAEEDQRVKQRNSDRLYGDDAMMTFGMFLAAGMAGGADAKKAAVQADQAIAEMSKRFT